ncbi:MAG: YhcG family protein [Oligosphaeraceae bacterium]
MDDEVVMREFGEIKSMIDASRQQALLDVNVSLIELYWRTGAFISQRLHGTKWGEGMIELLAQWLRQQDERQQGFSKRGIYRMVQFYETYSSPEFLQTLSRLGEAPEVPKLLGVKGEQAVGQVSSSLVLALLTRVCWSSHLLILSGRKTMEERLFYLLLCYRENLSSRELKRQIDSSMYERTMASSRSMTDLLRTAMPIMPGVFRDSYALELLGLPPFHDESELRRRIVGNLKDFFLVFGRDFTFVAEEYRLQVGNHDYYIDLLFFHRELRCLVAVELKVREFEPKGLGQLEFYLSALDHDVRKSFENPSIGLLLCKEKDDAVVQYALSRSASPAMIAEYTRLLPDKETVRRRMLQMLESLEDT